MNSAQPLLHPPLTDDEIAKLDEGLSRIDPDDSMAVEELDGYFAALACCPQPIPRDEWLPLVLGESPRAQAALTGQGEDARLLELIERHRVAVSAMLYDGQGFAPVLTHDEEGKAWGNAWAIGFVRGMALRPDAWAALEEDDEFADVLDPVMRLVADADIDDGEDGDDESEPDSQAVDLEASYEPIAEDEREAVIHEMMDGVQDVYEFFRIAREKALAPPTIRRDQPKVGRNDPCSCGSGRKFKNCCGASPAA
jgi:uncharacterized protein